MNLAPLDGWTALHAATGAASGLIGIPLPVFALVAVAYEIIEYAIEYPDGSRVFGSTGPESLANIIADLVTNLAGYALGRGLRGALISH